MILTEPDLALPRRVREVPCPTNPCQCEDQKREIADVLRTHAADISDAHLAVLLIKLSGALTVVAKSGSFGEDTRPATALIGVIFGAAAELAALEIGEKP